MVMYFGKMYMLNHSEKNRNKVKKYDITPDFQEKLINTKHSTKSMESNEKRTVHNVLKNVGF